MEKHRFPDAHLLPGKAQGARCLCDLKAERAVAVVTKRKDAVGPAQQGVKAVDERPHCLPPADLHDANDYEQGAQPLSQRDWLMEEQPHRYNLYANDGQSSGDGIGHPERDEAEKPG